METEFKGTPGPWHPVNYAGYIIIQKEPYYEDEDSDLLREDHCDKAIYNGQLAATAPELLEACQKARSIFLELTGQGKYPEMCLAINGGEGLGFLKKAIDKALNPKL